MLLIIYMNRNVVYGYIDQLYVFLKPLQIQDLYNINGSLYIVLEYYLVGNFKSF